MISLPGEEGIFHAAISQERKILAVRMILFLQPFCYFLKICYFCILKRVKRVNIYSRAGSD
jgi:hypothetical protein